MIQACQFLCFPFALDVDGDTLALVVEAVREAQIPTQLLQVSSSLPYCGDASPLHPPRHGTDSHHAGTFCPRTDVTWVSRGPRSSLASSCTDLLAAFSPCLTWPTCEDSALSAALSPFFLGLLSPSAPLVHRAPHEPPVPPHCI